MTLVLYQHPFASYCQKALIALYELGRPFDSHLVEGAEGREELARLWPLAGMPVLRDEDADLTLPESTTKIVGDELRPEGGRDPEGVAEARRVLDTAYGVLDARLADRPWAGGATFTVADCATFPAVFYTRAIHRWDAVHANITRYYRDLLARPSVARVVE